MFSLLQVLKHISAWQFLYICDSVIDSNQNQSEARKKSGFIVIKSSQLQFSLGHLVRAALLKRV